MSDKSDKDTESQERSTKRAKEAFAPGQARTSEDGKLVLFTEDELDIYCNKMTKEAFIFHSKDVDYKSLAHMVYDPDEFSVDVHLKDGSVMDLGVKIKWLIRPYFSKAGEVQIIKTKDGEPVDGHFVPLIHKGQEDV